MMVGLAIADDNKLEFSLFNFGKAFEEREYLSKNRMIIVGWLQPELYTE